jgi:hypothetical protein
VTKSSDILAIAQKTAYMICNDCDPLVQTNIAPAAVVRLMEKEGIIQPLLKGNDFVDAKDKEG